MDNQAAVLCTLASIVFLYVIRSSWNLGRRLPNMPPGPPTRPIVGNMLDMGNRRLHLRFHQWAKQYGDVLSVKALGQTMIIINSPTLLREIIDRHASASANRPHSIIAGMIVDDGLNMGLTLQTNDVWKAMRRAANQLLGNETMRKMATYQRAEAAQLMWEFANQSDAWFYHIRRFTTSLVLAVVYGIRGPTLHNPNVKGFMEVHPQFLDCLDVIGSMPPVDLFPFLTYIPERFAKWKEYPKKIRRLQEDLYDSVLSTVEKKMASGHGIGILMEELITKGPSTGIPTREHLMHLGGTLMEGSDTASSSLQVIVLALTRYPEVQKKAKEEMDRVVGLDRTPNENDIPDLKYMQAIIEECYRFRPVGTLGVPRAMAEDAVINGLFYPKGATLFVNFYSMFHDERYYDRPDEFIPERFLKHPYGIKDGVQDDPARRPNLVFGGGRRVCPGIAFAKSSIELNTANFIWAFDFLPAVDPVTGKEVYPDLDDYTEGITASPKPFPLRIRPRSAHHKELIDRQFQSVSDILSRYEYDLTPVDQEFNAKYRDL